jgi:hypothetical protein
MRIKGTGDPYLKYTSAEIVENRSTVFTLQISKSQRPLYQTSIEHEKCAKFPF